ncbi:MAG: SDR family oxidoreductase, partial [Glaciihabitans sp.]
VGRMVAQRIAGAGRPQRLLARTVAKAPELPGAGVLPFSYDDRGASTAALDGVTTLFMVSAAENEHRLDQHKAFIDSAVAAGVRHIVYTSFFGAAPDCVFTLGRDHYATEEYIKATGLAFTFLRDNFYLDFIKDLMGDDRVIRGPAGNGRVAGVARSDVAKVAATILLDAGSHTNTTYNLTGPEAITLADAAEMLSTATGTRVTFHNETVEEAYASRAKWGAPDWQNDAWVSTYTAIASGELAAVSPDVETLTGHRPLSLVEVLARG